MSRRIRANDCLILAQNLFDRWGDSAITLAIAKKAAAIYLDRTV
ncbi:hypothetical protein SRA_10268 [Streptococcus ratti FA-1 = DSM 20564]|uniref:Uncharacterized protein n=1 Tax=Streptococcus ratti FA-1 = DSM 20564 TaxID=699248 RepID=A0ABN0GSI0_STRRT|nr:hypothetical protein SRA_10268 [Streptococcus ratti FA-1 = DSM 20564]